MHVTTRGTPLFGTSSMVSMGVKEAQGKARVKHKGGRSTRMVLHGAWVEIVKGAPRVPSTLKAHNLSHVCIPKCMWNTSINYVCIHTSSYIKHA
jgi:hypothetical protein